MTSRHILPRLLLLFTLTLTGATAMATEEPVHTVSLKEEAFEVRDYPALIAAEVTVGGERSEAVSAGFRLLAGYIFGGNVRKQSIAMTAPVVQAKSGGESIAMTAPVTQVAAGSGWVIRFMMPAGYTLDTLPTPNDPKVHLVTLPPTRFAVVRFSGLAGEDSITEKTAELTAFITSHQLHAIGTASLARYDPPWTPWFMRRNEVMVPLAVATAP
ncbi:heme-binding protein [Actimicrobium antarcticum]|uniref:Heme-binding protein n=1 Tax=Actimicrobium antarcticum TaxID=1051899 RepID=A0ABP7TS74_9BURK